MGAGESNEQNLWRSSFELQSKNSRLGIIRLTDKQTEDAYMCRKLSVLDKRQMQQIERLIDIKLSIQSPYLVKLQKATSHNHHHSCSYGRCYYLLFKQPFQTLKQQTLSRKFKNSLYSQLQLEMMLEVGIKALYFLKNINHPHENISSSAFFINENRSMVLGDPFMFVEDNVGMVRNGVVYPSPEGIRYQQHEVEGYDKHLSDLFTFGVVLLQVFYMLNMDTLYQQHFQRLNHQAIHHKLSIITNLQLRKKLFILLDPQPRNRELIFKHYIKSTLPSKDIFDKLSKEKFKKTIDRYNLATSEVTEWKNDVGRVEDRLTVSGVEGKKTGSVSTNQNGIEEKLTPRGIGQQERQERMLSVRQIQQGTEKRNYYEAPKSYSNFVAHSSTQASYYPPVQPVQPNYLPHPLAFQKAPQPYYHQTNYSSYGQLPFQNSVGQLNSVERTFSNYQPNYIPTQPLLGNYSQALMSQAYSNVLPYSHFEQKQLQMNPSISSKITEISTNHQLNSNFNQFPYYQTILSQSRQSQTKNPSTKVSPISHPQSPNQTNNDQNNQQREQRISILTAQQIPQSVNTSITQKQPQPIIIHEPPTNNLLSPNQTTSTPAKQKIKHTDYNKYRHLSTINERSEMADSFISELHQNKSQVLILQNDLIAEKQRDYNSQRQNTHNSFVQQIKVWRISYPSGTKYMGEVKHDKRNGLGTFFYIDGSKYHGHWLDNKMNGFGTLYYPNGKIAYEGEWKMDNFHGKGKVYNDEIQHFNENYHYENCSDIDNYWLQYDGELMEDKKQGKGTLKLANGEYFEGEFKNDQLNGICRFYSRDNKIIEGLWEGGKLVTVISERIKE